MKVHFVCTGNAFRSRLAEAYLNSKKVLGLQASSSGIDAGQAVNGPICWYAARIVKYQDLVSYVSPCWQETILEHLKADLVIFMQDRHYQHCRDRLGFEGKNYEIWDIPDIQDVGLSCDFESLEKDLEKIKATEEIFLQIKEKTDQLLQKLGLKVK